MLPQDWREPGAGLDNRAAASQEGNRKQIFFNNRITSREVNDQPENTFIAELAFPTYLASVNVSALEHTLPQRPKKSLRKVLCILGKWNTQIIYISHIN